MMETLSVSTNSKHSLKLIQHKSGRASFLRTPIYTLGGDRIKIKYNNHDLSPEKYKALSSF